MRMWLVDPRIMCRQHLLGEHRELHALVGIIARGRSLTGYAANGLIETRIMKGRHDAIVDEMTRRGYHHLTPLTYVDGVDVGRIDPAEQLVELLRRCDGCRTRHAEEMA